MHPPACLQPVSPADEIDGAHIRRKARARADEVVALAPKLIGAGAFMTQFRQRTTRRQTASSAVSRTAGSSLGDDAD